MAFEWVAASRDFTYNGKDVKKGQIFQLEGCRNDGGLLQHNLVSSLGSDFDEQDMTDRPRCGECGRYFLAGWQRDRCGRRHHMSEEEQLQERRERTQDVEERIVKVGV